MVALFQLGGLLVADAEDHLAALAVHLPVRVGPFEVARQQLGALLDLLGLFGCSSSRCRRSAASGSCSSGGS